MGDPKTLERLLPRELAELVAFAERLERGWREVGCALRSRDFEVAVAALESIAECHADAESGGFDLTYQ